MGQTIEAKNKELVLEAFDRLFNKRDYEAAERYWSPNYIQHSAHIPPGRDGLFNLIKRLPATLRYGSGTVMAERDFVILHGRFSDFGLPVNWIVADISPSTRRTTRSRRASSTSFMGWQTAVPTRSSRRISTFRNTRLRITSKAFFANLMRTIAPMR